MKDYWKNIEAINDKQVQKGIATYGQTLEENTFPSAVERILYAQEEAVDFLKYLEWLKDAMAEQEDELRRLRMENMKLKLKSGLCRRKPCDCIVCAHRSSALCKQCTHNYQDYYVRRFYGSVLKND